jgi:hypothetical protein
MATLPSPDPRHVSDVHVLRRAKAKPVLARKSPLSSWLAWIWPAWFAAGALAVVLGYERAGGYILGAMAAASIVFFAVAMLFGSRHL